jgi:hypothetical protein
MGHPESLTGVSTVSRQGRAEQPDPVAAAGLAVFRGLLGLATGPERLAAQGEDTMLTRRRLIITVAVTVGAAVAAALFRRRGEPMGEEDPKRDILTRLTHLGPLPTDTAVSQAQLDEFSDIIAQIELAPPDPDYIRPLLDTFGYGDGFGLYIHGANALLRQERAAVVEATLDTLEAGRDGPRQWAMETLRRMREGDHGRPAPSAREVRLVEAALRGPELVALSAVYWAYWVEGNDPSGRRLLELGSRVATGEAKARAAELLAG